MIEHGLFEKLFPRTRFDWTGERQFRVIEGELNELEAEVLAEDKEKGLLEALDVMQATATYLYNTYTRDEIYQGLEAMQRKNEVRGYYVKQP